MSSIPTELAGTIQAGHIVRHPDAVRDIAPATASEKREPVSVRSVGKRYKGDDIDDGIDEDEDDDDDDDTDIPYSVLRPAPRSHNLPPLPDLRFEQSYLHSISKANSWMGVALITLRDQIMMPLAQGMVYNLLLCGWQHWNRNARLHGNTIGARVRRWWWGVNNWSIPVRKRQ
jgi:hypothetical protein